MEWVKLIRRHDAGGGGWRSDLPLSTELPDAVEIDCRELDLPIHPMFMVRLKVFAAWHGAAGRSVLVRGPALPEPRIAFQALFGEVAQARTDFEPAPLDRARVLVPVTRIASMQDVDELADVVRTFIEYEATDIARLGHACFMAVAELGSNSVEHGRNGLGTFIAAAREPGDRRMLHIAVADVGMGIPEHLRARFPEWADDAFVIGQALEDGVSGTGGPHRGFGFGHVFEAALSSAAHAARIEIQSATGFLRREIVQERRVDAPMPAAQYRRGTWINVSLVAPG